VQEDVIVCKDPEAGTYMCVGRMDIRKDVLSGARRAGYKMRPGRRQDLP
jgi:hypothetical protein